MLDISRASSRSPAKVQVAPLPVIGIKPFRGWVFLNLRDLWEHRELLYFPVWRDVKVRFKQMVLAWPGFRDLKPRN